MPDAISHSGILSAVCVAAGLGPVPSPAPPATLNDIAESQRSLVRQRGLHCYRMPDGTIWDGWNYKESRKKSSTATSRPSTGSGRRPGGPARPSSKTSTSAPSGSSNSPTMCALGAFSPASRMTRASSTQNALEKPTPNPGRKPRPFGHAPPLPSTPGPSPTSMSRMSMSTPATPTRATSRSHATSAKVTAKSPATPSTAAASPASSMSPIPASSFKPRPLEGPLLTSGTWETREGGRVAATHGSCSPPMKCA